MPVERVLRVLSVLFLVVCAQQALLAQAHLKFIENKNQWPGQVDFAARVPGGNLFVSPVQFSIYLIDEEALHDRHEQGHTASGFDEASGEFSAADETIAGHIVQLNFIGANPSSVPQAGGISSEYYNYFIGNDSSRWASRAHAYKNILYSSVYENIDVRISSVEQNLKYDFVVKAEASPELIQLEYCGADLIYLNNGNLIIKTTLGDLIEKKPFSYQVIDGVMCEVNSEYKLNNGVITFNFPEGYDHCYELVIDPLLIFSTYSGSTADNWGSTATPGERGTLYSSGITNHLNAGGTFPATAGAFQTTYGGVYDVAILKYDSAGKTMLYASYLGGDFNETPHSLVMDNNNDLIVMGTTSSLDFPVSANAVRTTFAGGVPVNSRVLVQYQNGSDIFVTRISADGTTLKSSTYLGGTNNDGINPMTGPLTRNYGDEMRGDVITDEAGDVYISSVVSSSDFPVVNSFSTTYKGGVTDALVLKLNADLSQVIWGAYIGGNAYDASHTIKFDADKNLYIAGGTTSANFPVTAGRYQTTLRGDADGWIAHIANDGSAILNATYTGTPQYDQVYFVDLSSAGEVYVYGQTNGAMPVTTGVYRNANSGQFVQKFTSSLNSIMFSTVFGSGIGIPNISPTAFLVNDCNNLYMSGWGGNTNAGFWPGSSTRNMPTTPDALQRTTGGDDFYFIVLTDDATELLYATFFGGNESATHVDGGTSRFDKSGIVYHAVCAGCGGGFDDFPTTPGAWSRTNNSGNCNNAAFKFDLSSLRARLQTNSVAFNAPGLDKVCYPDSIRFQNFSTGGEIYVWDLGDGTTLSKGDTTSFVHQYQEEGVYTVILKAIDQNTCIGVDVAQKQVFVYKNDLKAQEDDALCFGGSYQLTGSGGVQYDWSTAEGAISSAWVSPQDTTQYFVTITDSDGCIKRDTVQLNVVPFIDLRFDYRFVTDCFSRPSIQLQNKTRSKADEMYIFDFNDGFTTDANEVIHAYEEDGDYVIKLSGVKEFCVYEKSIELPVYTLKVPNIITPGKADAVNDTFFVQYGEDMRSPEAAGIQVNLKVFNRWGVKVYESADYRNDWGGEGVETGIYYYHVTLGEYATCKSWLHIVK